MAATEHPDRYAVEVSPGLAVALDASNCIVLRSERPVHTVTNVARLKEVLDVMLTYQAVEDQPTISAQPWPQSRVEEPS